MDGNEDNGDGCSATGTLEEGWTCGYDGGLPEFSACSPIYGDAILVGDEECD